jgi:hypothetical protein
MYHRFENELFSAIHAGLFAATQFPAKFSLYPVLQTHVLVYPPNCINTVLWKQAGGKTLTHRLCIAFGPHLLLAITKKKTFILLKT